MSALDPCRHHGHCGHLYDCAVMYCIIRPCEPDGCCHYGHCNIILAALIAVKQNDIKKVLAYSTVSHWVICFSDWACLRSRIPCADPRVLQSAFISLRRIRDPRHGRRTGYSQMGGLKKPARHPHHIPDGCIAISGIPPSRDFFKG